MLQHQKRHLNLQELLVKTENLLRSLVGTLEGGEMEVTRKGKVKNIGGRKGLNIDYSFSLKNLADDNSDIKDFRNTCRGSYKHPNTRLLDIFDLKDQLIVVAEIPTVKEEDIKVSVDRGKLSISVDALRRYWRRILLPTRVEKESFETTYKNGVLEVKLKKALQKL